jgi:hypothetical protein
MPLIASSLIRWRLAVPLNNPSFLSTGGPYWRRYVTISVETTSPALTNAGRFKTTGAVRAK